MNAAIGSLNATLDSLNKIVADESTRQVPAQLNNTLTDLRSVLASFAADSPASQSINSSLLRLNRTLNNLKNLTRTLSEQPNAVVFPSGTTTDPIPKANP